LLTVWSEYVVTGPMVLVLVLVLNLVVLLTSLVVGYWRRYLSGARCRLAYGPADATDTHCLLLQ